MEKYILFLDDSVRFNRYFVELLKKRSELSNYKIKSVHRIDLAIDFFDEHKEEICCIITDLNMNDEWLDEEWIHETCGGLFTGWVWLQHCVHNEKPDIPAIIFSSYSSLLLKEYHLDENELNHNNIFLVNKGFNIFEVLLSKLKEILNQAEKGLLQ